MYFLLSILIILVSIGCPFLVFLDYHKKANIRYAVIYLIAFFITIGGLLPFLTLQYGMVFAGSLPIVFLLFILISKKRSQIHQTHGKAGR